MKVNEFLESIRPDDDSISRFNRSQFIDFLSVLANDGDFEAKYARTKGDSYKECDVNVSKEFRKTIRKILIKLGLDKTDTSVIMDYDFTFDDLSGLYDLFTTAMYEYMANGKHKFEIPSRKDFSGYLYILDVEANEKEYSAVNPATGEELGKYVSRKQDHKILKSKSQCPKWLNEKLKK